MKHNLTGNSHRRSSASLYLHDQLKNQYNTFPKLREGRGLVDSFMGAESGPLWRIFPTKDEKGNNLTDFMMIMPGFKYLCSDMKLIKVKMIKNILHANRDVVVFANLNLRINSLIVSVRPVPGITIDLPMKIHAYVPEAKLVSADLGF